MKEGFPIKLYPHHAGIFVSDIERSIKWYEEMLGFKFMFKNVFDLPNGPTTMAWVRHGDFYLELYDYPKAGPFSRKDYDGTLGTKHISFYVNNKDFEPLKAFLKSKGIQLTVEHRWTEKYVVNPAGIGVIYFYDPDGIPIEVHEEYTPGEY
jgi:lactoylglutathione lyase